MDWINIIYIIILFCLIVLSGFFSGSETAYTSITTSKLNSKLAAKPKTKKIVQKQLKSFGWTLVTILIGNNIVNIAASTLTVILLSKAITDDTTIALVATAAITPIIVVFGEVLPKVFAKKYAYGYIQKVAWTMQILNWLFAPFSYPLKLLNIIPKITNTEKDLHEIIDVSYKEGVLEKGETILVKNALELDSTKVRKHYIRAKNIVFVTTKMDIKTIKQVFIESKLSRLPVKHKRTFIGIVTLKDIFEVSNKATIQNLILEIPYISQNIILSNALDKLRINRTHMAFITPNQNSQVILGIITIEDILEEIVGELYDEHDVKNEIIEGGLNKLIVEGNVKIKKVNHFFDGHEQFSLFNILGDQNLTIEAWLKKQTGKNIRINLKWTYNDLLKFKVIANKRGELPRIEISVK